MTLQFELSRPDLSTAAFDCLVLGVYADGSLATSTAAIDSAADGRIKALVERGDIAGKPGRTAMLLDVAGTSTPRVLLVGLGEKDKFGIAAYQRAVGDAVRALKTGPVTHALLTLTELAVPDRDADWNIRQAAIAADSAAYAYTQNISKKPDTGLQRISLLGDAAQQKSLDQGIAIAAGIACTRELGNLPPNICNPGYLADEGRRIAGEHATVTCEVLEQEDMEKLGMGSLLAVGRGSANPSRLVVLKYDGGGDAKPFVLVGKGITFDSGGLNLKVQGGIEEMKFDMLGAATVIGTLVAAAKMDLALNLVVVVPAVENMTGDDAYRPSDVLTSMSGKTIEVLNTDAEGRLVLCDALTYAQRFEPQALVDVATLTGACVVALGKVATGLMSKHDDLADELVAAGNHVHDRAWRLPLWDDYQSLLDSAFADVANIGGKYAGAITAGCFLSRFTEGQRWAHLDIAGTSSGEGRKGIATGRPVGLLCQWLMDRVA
ncbi:MAG: leucyl aminopeptidase [Lysobacteraceae bacterium]